MKDGDANTHFFHAQASTRRKKKFIHKLQDGQGVWNEHLDLIGNTTLDYFFDIFYSSASGSDLLSSFVWPQFYASQNVEFLAFVSEEKVYFVVFVMHPDK